MLFRFTSPRARWIRRRRSCRGASVFRFFFLCARCLFKFSLWLGRFGWRRRCARARAVEGLTGPTRTASVFVRLFALRWKRVQGPFPENYGCVGVKEDGGGSMRGRGTVGAMKVHRACFNRKADLLRELVANGEDINEVDGAGVTPIMCAAYEGWAEGIDVLVELGAKVNASNNAGDTAWVWADTMNHEDVQERLKHHGADPEYLGQVIVPEHIPKVKDFYDGEEGKLHPKPSEEYLEYMREQERLAQDDTDNALQI